MPFCIDPLLLIARHFAVLTYRSWLRSGRGSKFLAKGTVFVRELIAFLAVNYLSLTHGGLQAIAEVLVAAINCCYLSLDYFLLP